MLNKESILVDSHCHAGESWYEPIESLIYQLDKNQITKAVLIGHMGAYENNDYLLECKKKFDGRFAVVGVFDFDKYGVRKEDLKNLKLEGIDGVRIAAKNIVKPEYRLVLDIISRFGLVISCLGEWPEFIIPNFLEIAKTYSNLNIVIEHLAGISSNSDYQYEYCQKVVEFSNYGNIYIKIPGLGEINSKPNVLLRKSAFGKKFEPLFDVTLKNFGSQRMMWGSDYPPVSNREGYLNAFNDISNCDIFHKGNDLNNIMGQTAYKLFWQNNLG